MANHLLFLKKADHLEIRFNCSLMHTISIYQTKNLQFIQQNNINNLREKFSPGPGIEPGSPALRAGAITTKPPRRSAGPS